MVEDKLRNHFDYSLGKVEVVIYSVLALLLSVTVLAAIASAGKLLWDALRHWAIATQTLPVLMVFSITLVRRYPPPKDFRDV